MPQTIRRFVFGPVPRVHDCEVAVVGSAAGVDLAGAGAAAVGGAAGGVETAAVGFVSVCRVSV